jgi:hypothetical protein
MQSKCFGELITVDRRYSYERMLSQSINITVLNVVEEFEAKKSCWERMCTVS